MVVMNSHAVCLSQGPVLGGISSPPFPLITGTIQHLLVKAGSRITAYFVTIFPLSLSMHKSRNSHGYSNTKTFMGEVQIIIVPMTQPKIRSVLGSDDSKARDQ